MVKSSCWAGDRTWGTSWFKHQAKGARLVQGHPGEPPYSQSCLEWGTRIVLKEYCTDLKQRNLWRTFTCLSGGASCLL